MDFKKMRSKVVMGLLIVSFSVNAEEKLPGVKTLMTGQEFKNAGLEKLTLEEIEALDAWLIRFTAGDAKILRASNNKEVRKARDDYEIRASIKGSFTGWNGKTIFHLSNGQTWEQRLSGRYEYNGAPNPRVLIKRNWAGYFRMTVIDTGKSIGVSPVSH